MIETQTAPRPTASRPTASPPTTSVWSRVLDAAHDLVASTQPAVVLSSLAAVSVPTFSDGCHVLVQEHEPSDGDGVAAERVVHPRPQRDSTIAHRISNPPVAGTDPAGGRWTEIADDGAQRITADAVTTPLQVPALVGAPAYRGTVVHQWSGGYHPGPADAALAQLLVQRAVALVHTERAQALLADSRAVVGQLQEAVATNRDIGAAVGILMHARHLSYDDAFRALVVASQHSNTKLHTVCRRVLTDRALLADPAEHPRCR